MSKLTGLSFLGPAVLFFVSGLLTGSAYEHSQTKQIRADLDKREQELQVRADLILSWEEYWHRMLNMNDEKKYRLHEPHRDTNKWKGANR